jgi:NADH-quinone oxidoreductase subunit N
MNDYTIVGFNGLAKQQPALAITSTVFLLSLTGIPLTAGFQAKFYMLVAALRNGQQHWLIIFAVLCAAISAYYYFKIIQAMFFKEGNLDEANLPVLAASNITSFYKYTLIIMAVLIIVLGIFPNLIIDWLLY